MKTILALVMSSTLALIPASIPKTTEIHAPVQQQDSLDLWIDKLIQLESSGRENIKILDTNNRYSFGCLQYQKSTFISYGLKYGILATSTDWESRIYDCGLQRKLTREIVTHETSGWRNWATSVQTKNLGTPPIPEKPEN